MSLFEELKRRNVFRVSIAYIVAAWVIIQVADIVLENIGAPAWFFQALFLLLAIGFVAAVIISWAFEVTPEGIRRESEVDRTQSVTHETGKRLNVVTIALVLTAVALLVADRLAPRSDAPQSAAETVPAATPSPRVDTGTDARSIAVLPFIALSDDSSDAYFGKGIAEELLNALAQFSDLNVAARTSAFSFDGKDIDLREVGEKLGVAHVLEGSVRRAGDRVRVTAQLIRTADGFHLWSETYERTLTDIFRIQDEIVANLAQVLQFRLGVGVGVGRAEDRDVNAEAYEQYLKGLELWWTRSQGDNRALAISSFRRATELDPNFADAWSAMGASLSLSPPTSAPFLSQENFRGFVADVYERALTLDPVNARAHAGLAFWHANVEIDVEKSAFHLERALELSPNGAFSNYAAANYYFSIADKQQTFDRFERAIAIDPLNQTLRRVKFESFTAMGRFEPPPRELLERAECIDDVCDAFATFAAYFILQGAIAAGTDEDIRAAIERIERTRSSIEADAAYMRAQMDTFLEFARQTINQPPEYVLDLDTVAALESGPSDPWVNCVFVVRLGLGECDFERMSEVIAVGSAFPGVSGLLPLLPGKFEMPESVRRDPRYHDVWLLPGMPELAAARRANGVSAGLPLPFDATSDTP